jgi:hypothetical protein
MAASALDVIMFAVRLCWSVSGLDFHCEVLISSDKHCGDHGMMLGAVHGHSEMLHDVDIRIFLFPAICTRYRGWLR